MDTITENIALLIDADNSPCKRIDFVLAELAKYGVVNIRRAYGNWKSPTLTGWEAVLHDYAIRPMQQFDYTKCVLEVGCGCGQTSLELAGRVGPQG